MTPLERDRTDRAAWLLERRRENVGQEDALSVDYDEHWGRIGEMHRAVVERFCAMLPPGGRVLDAACGTGKYFGMVLEHGLAVVGVDHSPRSLDVARSKFPAARTEVYELQQLPFVDAFDGVICVDAMEFVPPEDWPVVLERFHRALRPRGVLYLTVELVAADEVRAANEQARHEGLPVVDGEVIWHDPEPYYHYYPALADARAWMTRAGFTILEEAEGPWDEGYAYHHVLARCLER